MRLRPRLQVDVLTGFLGSGKTTLLRNHLRAIPSAAVAVIINEFGAVSIDHRLVLTGDDSVRVLSKGCACCTVADELRSVLLELLREDAARGSHLERILIETSGLADPAVILNTLHADEALAEYLQRGRCVATFDVLEGMACAQAYPEVRRQLAAADNVVFTKADLATDEALRRAIAFVAEITPLARHHVAGTSKFSVESLFRNGESLALLPQAPSRVDHSPGVNSFTLRLEQDLDWASFSIWLTCLLNRHGSRILRFKGVLECRSHVSPLVIHGVRHLTYPPQHLPQASARGYSDLVFIVDGLDPTTVERSLRAFLAFAASIGDAKRGGAVESSREDRQDGRVLKASAAAGQAFAP